MWRIATPKVFFSNLQIAQNSRRAYNGYFRKEHKVVTQKQSYVHGHAEIPLSGATIGQVLDSSAERFGSKEAIIVCHQNIRKTFAQFKADVDKTAAGLISATLRRGDRVAVIIPNSYEWILLQYATAKLGIIMVAMNPAYHLQEIAHILKKVEARALVAARNPDDRRDVYDSLVDIMPELPESQAGQMKSVEGAYELQDIMDFGGTREMQMLREIEGQQNMDDVINIHFSSGTTGTPKAIPLTHHSMVNNATFIGRRLNYHIQPEKVCLLVPLYHCFGSVAGTLCSIIHGATTVIPSPRFRAPDALSAIHRERCTSIYGTPTMFIDMMNHAEFPKADLSCVKHGILGGAPCLPGLIYSIATKFNCPGITPMYGCTETGPIIASTSVNDDINTKLRSAGRALDHVEIKIVDPDNCNNTLPLGVKGEICVRGPMIMRGYIDDERANAAMTKNGWYLTGDIGILDEAGELNVISRKKDMICRGGEKIFPREIENCLMKHQQIQDAHVFGVPDERMGEEVSAWIKIRGNVSLTDTDIKKFCKHKMAHFKIPKYIKFVDDFPVNMLGKVSKQVLQDEMLKCMNTQ